MSSESRWPFHPTLMPEEALSSWIKRIAHEYNNDFQAVLNVETLRGFYLNSVDRNPSVDLVDHLSKNSGISKEILLSHTLSSFEDNYPKRMAIKDKKKQLISGLEGAIQYSRNEHFILGIRSKKNLSYCPECLKEGTSYFRIQWLLGYYLVCLRHNIIMSEKCEHCNKMVSYVNQKTPIQICQYCKRSLTEASKIKMNPQLVKIIHEAFYNKISPFETIDAQSFLHYIWDGVIKLKIIYKKDLVYFKKIVEFFDCKIYSFERKEENSILYTCLNLSYSIIKRNVENQIENPFSSMLVCIHCNSYFRDNSDLNRHLEFHNKKVNYQCRYCESNLVNNIMLTNHYRIKHEKEIMNSIYEAIKDLKREKKSVTYKNVAERIGIARNNLKQEPFINLFKKENIFLVRWKSIAYSKILNKDEIEEKKIELIRDVITKLNEKGKSVTISSVAKEIGCQRNAILNDKTLNKLINENRNSSNEEFYINILNGLLRENKFEEQLNNIINSLIDQKKSLKDSAIICRLLGIDKIDYTQLPNIKTFLEKQTNYYNIKKNLRSKKSETAKWFENGKFKKAFYPKLEEFLKECLASDSKISIKNAAFYFNCTTVSFYTDQKAINLVDEYKELELNRKKNKIVKAIEKLKEDNQRPTYKIIRDETLLPFKFIIAEEQKELIKSLI